MRSIFSKKKNIIFLMICITVILVVAFFLFRDKVPSYRDRVAPDMILARSCGMDYLPCCDVGPECSFGQKCCANPEDKKDRYCADECGCGGKLEFCCGGTSCNEGLVCNFGRCEECGNNGDICCDMNQCDEGLVCDNNECKQCGIPGNPCCAQVPYCLNNSTSTERVECRSNVCRQCGSSGDIACIEQPNCDNGNLLNNDFCYKCGTKARPCCQFNGEMICEDGFECKKGFCSDEK